MRSPHRCADGNACWRARTSPVPREVRHRGQRFLTIVPIDPRLRPLRLEPDLATDAAFEAWIAALPISTRKTSRSPKPGFSAIGATVPRRKRGLPGSTAVRTLAKLLNAVALVVAAWCLVAPGRISPRSRWPPCFPCWALIMVAISGGLVRFTRSTAEAHAAATLTPVFVPPCWCGASGGCLPHRFKRRGESRWRHWPILALAVIVDRSLIRFLAIAAVVAVAYGISVVTLADVQLDRSPGENSQSQVVDSHVSRGKNSRTYFVRLAPWGTPQSASEVSVPEAMFNWLTMSRACPRVSPCTMARSASDGSPWTSVGRTDRMPTAPL